MLDFSANINPLGLPEAAREAAVEAIGQSAHYPDPECRRLRHAIAAREGVSPEAVLCGNGAADLIYRFTFALRPQTALVLAPTFGEYEAALAACGCGVRRHRLGAVEGFRLTEAILRDLDGIEALYLCNPNNPTGQTIVPALLLRILQACRARGIHVLLDECFLDFLDEPQSYTLLPLLGEYPGLVILRAFTKIYAMPGLRAGYALCVDEELLARINAAGAPWSVSAIAQAAAAAALSDYGYIARTRALIAQERGFMRQMLRQMGIDPLGEANFLLFQAPPGLAEKLARAGILVRACDNFEGLGGDWIRIAIRTRAENTRLISMLGRILHG